MGKTGQNLRKLSLNLNTGLFFHFNLYANQAGVTKSSILREWIDEALEDVTKINLIPLQSNYKNYFVTYTIRLDAYILDKLDDISYKCGITKSNLVRLIIRNKLRHLILPQS